MRILGQAVVGGWGCARVGPISMAQSTAKASCDKFSSGIAYLLLF